MILKKKNDDNEAREVGKALKIRVIRDGGVKEEVQVMDGWEYFYCFVKRL